MRRGKKELIAKIIGSTMGLSIGLFKFWPFTLIFLILGIIAHEAISAVSGSTINFFIVLIIEYLLMTAIISVVFYIVKRRHEMRYVKKKANQ